MVSNNKFSFHIYLLMWVIYSFNGIIYEPSSIIARLSLLVIMLLSFVNLYLVLSKKRYGNPYIKSLSFLLLIFTFYGILFLFDPYVIYNKSGEPTPHYIYIKTIYMALLPFFSFYYYSLVGVLSRRTLTNLIPLLLIIAIVKFVDNQMTRIDMMAADAEGVTNNMGYQFVALLPYAFLIEKKRIIQYSFLIVLIVFTLIAVKRGAILIAFVWLLWFILCSIKNVKKNTKVLMIIGSLLLLAVAYFVFQYIASNNPYFAARLDDTMSGDAGERDWMYTYMFEWYLNSNTTTGLIFGNGPYTSIKLLGMPAHNDWLEIALAQGFLGVVTYLLYWLGLAKTAFNQKKNKCTLSYVISISFLLIYFIKSLFSMSYASIPFAATLILGFAMAQGTLGINNSNHR